MKVGGREASSRQNDAAEVRMSVLTSGRDSRRLSGEAVRMVLASKNMLFPSAAVVR